jgi:hypothetical protein
MAARRNDHSPPRETAIAAGLPLTVIVSMLPTSMASFQVVRRTPSRP